MLGSGDVIAASISQKPVVPELYLKLVHGSFYVTLCVI
jgi:hypothetical protein